MERNSTNRPSRCKCIGKNEDGKELRKNGNTSKNTSTVLKKSELKDDAFSMKRSRTLCLPGEKQTKRMKTLTPFNSRKRLDRGIALEECFFPDGLQSEKKKGRDSLPSAERKLRLKA